MTVSTVNQFHSGTACGDAITNEMLAIQRVLAAAGYESNIYAEHIVDQLSANIQDINKYHGSRDNVLLVHHSMGFDCFDRIVNLPDRKILIYHNITPPEYLADNPFSAAYAEKGRAQLQAYRDHVDFAFADSEFNRCELTNAGFSQADVLPVTFALQQLGQVEPNHRLAESLASSTNFLFVGRIAPNKKQDDIIKSFSYYRQKIEPHCRLFLVGGFEGANGYYKMLRRLAEEEGIADSVFFTGRVSDEDLVAYYKNASVFLSMSEHEGFGVPLVESMLFDVPVVAYKAAAVPLTLGGAGVLFTHKDIPMIAEMVDCVIKDQHLRKKILDGQRRRLEEIRSDRFVPRLIAAIEELSPGTRTRTTTAISKSIQIQGPFETTYSLAIVNRNLARALSNKTAVEISLHATEGSGDYAPRPEDLMDKPDIERLWRKSMSGARVDWVIRNIYPPRVSDLDQSKLNFFYFYWEDSLVSNEWAENFNRYLDGLMVPSRHVLTALRNSGVAIPIEVIHTGVEAPFEASESITPLELATKKTFRFLHVSSGFPRKGCDVLLRAYINEFSQDDDVCLIIKTFPNIHNTVNEQIAEMRSRKRACPEIIHIDRDLDPRQMSSLYRSSSCLVHPARAEGFGLPVAEAMLARLPVIVTNYSGLTEFCNEETALLVDYKLAESGSHFNVERAEWAEPDTAHLRAHMRNIYENPLSVLEKVDRAASLISRDFTWSCVADRAIEFMRSVETRSRRTIRAGMVTTWNSACGIAEYSKYLVDAVPNDKIKWTILAQYGELTIGPDSREVIRCWEDRWHGNLAQVLRETQCRSLDVVHFQFNFGFFELRDFACALSQLKKEGRKVFITFHSTKDLVIDGGTVSLAQIAASLRAVDRILVHNDDDRKWLTSLGISENVTLFPHGFPSFESRDPEEIKTELSISASPVISTFGFLVPHKGLLELIEAVSILREDYPDVMLLALTSFHPNAPSREYYELCLRKACELEIHNRCKIITQFLSPAEIVTALQASDVIVLPYHQTNESSSAAVRFPLASHRPVITTKQPVFRDVADAVYQIEAPMPSMISEAIRNLLNSPARVREVVARAERKAAKDSWSNIAGMYSKIIRCMPVRAKH
ncbi:MAG: glycosyltransferase [Acidobacteriota bacterium]